jgi:hypothetical protein
MQEEESRKGRWKLGKGAQKEISCPFFSIAGMGQFQWLTSSKCVVGKCQQHPNTQFGPP